MPESRSTWQSCLQLCIVSWQPCLHAAFASSVALATSGTPVVSAMAKSMITVRRIRILLPDVPSQAQTRRVRSHEEGIAGGLRFANVEPPDYWDFLYFSFSLAMCYGVTDVAVTSRRIRRVTLLQTLLSFFYYTVIIGLVMNTIGALF